MGLETRKVISEYRREVLNEVTGEVMTTEAIKQTMIPREPEFIKLYLQDVMYLQDLPTSLNAVMYQFLKSMDYDNNITLNAGRKRIIAETTGLSVSTVNNAISSFVKSKLLERVETGIYRVNPFLFGKGDWRHIQQIRMEVTYSLAGKTIKSVIRDVEEVQGDS